ncbi:hypothetical protein EV356DRAFT_503548 [Viridothelium virens]|uniref:NACHT domain-containing protein n=1 Tax=Viridothelium virens TaxID=1048519 RepID=A0A6A6H5V4_VIRVR|nr:hypothetical protein EV356DRAFT_503548 [Viridothelium virens]
MASTSPSVAPQARLTFQETFDRIKTTVSEQDARQFQSTTLKDVRDAAIDLEARLGERKSLRNMRRIQPFLDGLDRYSSAVEVLCNGTPFLPWIWAPVKLVLELSSGFAQAFELIISAYKDIAQTLPRFDRLSATFKAEPDFQHVLAVFYADVVEFHRRSYQFVRRKGWKTFFLSSWAYFASRYKKILADLAKHSELVDKEAAAFAYAEAKDWRENWNEQISKQEEERATSQFDAVMAWLDIGKWDQECENELCRLSSRCQRGSCDWIFQTPKMKAWTRQGPQQTLVWMKGKPGSGKSVLCSKIIESLQNNSSSTVLYYFCTLSTIDGQTCAKVLRSLAAQALRAHPEISSWIYDEFICQNKMPSLAQLRILFPTMLSILPSTRIVLDGLDEFEADQYKPVLTEIDSLLRNKQVEGGSCKVLISSRDLQPISRVLGRRSQISLNEEHQAINCAIQQFVEYNMQEIQANIDDIPVDGGEMADISRALVEKAEGMFLWVQLVVKTLEDIYSIEEMYQAVNTLPRGLDEVYSRIWSRIEGQLDGKGLSNVIRIFEWIAFGERPLKKYEVQAGVSLYHESTVISANTQMSRNVFHLCKPLLEDGPHDTVRFVHSSVKEYLLKYKSHFEHGLLPHYDIAFACTSYLLKGLTLVDPSYSEDQSLMDVGKGYHRLQIYSNEFWLEHILKYASLACSKHNVLPPTKLLLVLQDFCREYISISSRNGQSKEKKGQKQILEMRDSRFEFFKPYENIYSILLSLATFRRISIETPGNRITARAVADAYQDSTLFTSMLHKYYSLVQHLGTAEMIKGLPDKQLATFKRLYGPSAFPCRIRGCPRSSDGFENDRDRVEHEELHTLNLYCPELSCEYHKLGFLNARALKKHMEYHNVLHRTPPDTLRRGHPTLDDPKASQSSTEGFQLDVGRLTDDEEDNQLSHDFDLDIPSELIPSSKPRDLKLEKEDSFALATTSWDDVYD